MRKLASIRQIAEINPIEGADAIEVATVDGWKVVIKKGEYAVGALVVYLEIDSWVPTELAPFLSKGQEPREYNGVKGERLRTVKLRGQISQGLLLPVEWHGDRDKFPCILAFKHEDGIGFYRQVTPGDDVTEALNIQKWESVLPAQLAGMAAGLFPTSLIPKTDQERIQNCFGEIQKKAYRFLTQKVWNAETQVLEEHPVEIPKGFREPTYEVTMKLDGSSCTIFRWEDELRVCSRNLELKIVDENSDNAFVAMALQIGDRIRNGMAVQGELMGPGIQGNREGFTQPRFFVFDVYDINDGDYYEPVDRRYICRQLDLEQVPVLGENWIAPPSVEEGLAMAEGPSLVHSIREGLVWKCNEDPKFSFKIISNKFLLKGEH